MHRWQGTVRYPAQATPGRSSASRVQKVSMIGRDLSDLSLDTVKMFRRDAVAAGFECTE
jgi:hypothetical protein